MAMSLTRPDPSSPASVADAKFSTGRRGFDQNEVRGFLRMVAAELGRLQERERFLERELRTSQENPEVGPAQFDDETLTRLLGEETARVLTTARESAVEIRHKAEQSASQLLTAASDEAARVREEAEVEASRRRADAGADAEAELSMAKQQGREMVNEARAYRERVLSELARRRELAREQIEQLLHGRDRLMQSFERARVVAVDVVAELQPLGEPDEYVNLAPTTGPVPVMLPGTPRPDVRRPTGPLEVASEHTEASEVSENVEVEHEAVEGDNEVLAAEMDNALADDNAEVAADDDTALAEFVEFVEFGDDNEGADLDASSGVTDFDGSDEIVAGVVGIYDRDVAEADDAITDPATADDVVAAVADDAEPDPADESDTDVAPPDVATLITDASGDSASDDAGAAVAGSVADTEIDTRADETGETAADVSDTGAADATADDADADDAAEGDADVSDTGAADATADDADADDAAEGDADVSDAEAADATADDSDVDDPETATMDDDATDTRAADVTADDADVSDPETGDATADAADVSDPEAADDTAGDADVSDPEAADATADDDDVSDPEAADATVAHLGVADGGVVQVDEASMEAGVVPADDTAADGEAERDDVVVDLFARLRADATTAMTRPTAAVSADTAPVDNEVIDPTIAEPTAGDDAEDAQDDLDIVEVTPFAQRDADLTPLIVSSARRIKRVLADEQNEALDALRRNEPVSALAALLPAVTDHLEQYRAAIVDDLTVAANAGATATGRSAALSKSDVSKAVIEASEVLDEWITVPLRERLERCVIDGDGDNASIGRSVRAVYREWKTQHIDEQLDDVLRTAHGRGAFAAIAAGTPIAWVSDPNHQACADCDDNTLAGSVPAGDVFPTGHRFAPAHLGCRCMLSLADR